MSIGTVGVIGGTGPAGKGVAFRLAMTGLDVVIGSRELSRAESTCSEVDRGYSWRSNLSGGTNEDAARCGLVVLATPWEGLASTVEPLSEILSGKVVVTMANALVRVGKEFQPVLLAKGSVAALVASLLPNSQVVSAFQHVPARELLEVDSVLHADVIICGDDPGSKLNVREIFDRIEGVRLLDGGSLALSGAIEAMTAVLLNLNLRYKTRTSIRVSGIEA